MKKPTIVLTYLMFALMGLNLSYAKTSYAKTSKKPFEEKVFFTALDIIEHGKNAKERQQAFQTLFDLSQKKDMMLAQETLAGMYLIGYGMAKNEKHARVLYESAAQKGYGPAQFNCGIVYKNGQGGPKNFKKAYYYLALAALNKKDLEDMTQDAARYRDEISVLLTSEERWDVLQNVFKTKR